MSIDPMDAAFPTDADIVARIASGDRAAETEFANRYMRGVRALVRRHCRPNDPVAEDIAQDVLTRVLEKLRGGAIRDGQALPAYVQSTVVYATSAEYRSRRAVFSSAAIAQIEDPDNPAERVSSDQVARILKQLLDALPVARDREVLSRFYLDEQGRDDVCRVLGIDESHFHRVIFRARERFRELLVQAGIQGA